MTNRPLAGLKALRKGQDVTQADCAAAMGVTQSQFNKFETGAVRLDVHRAATLASFLRCKIEALL